jgi:hypothetical protein
MEKLNITTPFEDIADDVTAKNEKSTEVLQLSVSTQNPELSQNFLREAVISFKEQAKILYGADNLNVVDNASTATPPYNVDQPRQLAIASAAGLFIALVVLFFIYDVKGDTVKPQVKKVLTKKSTPVKKAPTAVAASKQQKAIVAKAKPSTKSASTTKTVAKKAVSKKTVAKKPPVKKPTAKKK